MPMPMDNFVAKGYGIHVPTAKLCTPRVLTLACVVVQCSVGSIGEIMYSMWRRWLEEQNLWRGEYLGHPGT
jgi:hypothetical protein